jgi:hypothetical protein
MLSFIVLKTGPSRRSTMPARIDAYRYQKGNFSAIRSSAAITAYNSIAVAAASLHRPNPVYRPMQS